MMDQKKTILVTGTAGAQCASVATHLLQEGNFSVRYLTNNTQSNEARELANAGAELVLGDSNHINRLLVAMNGVYGVFAATGFNEHFEKEYQQGKNIIDAVAQSGIEHFIYSSLPIKHADGRTALQAYAKKKKPNTSFVHVPGYYENFSSCFLPHKMEDGNYYLQLPQANAQCATIGKEDLGGIISSMFRFPEVYLGRTVGATGADMPFAEYAAILSKVLDINVVYQPISWEDYTALYFPGTEELSDMFAYNRLHTRYRSIDMIESYGLNPFMKTFESWVMENKILFQQLMAHQEEAVA
jgi:uncharacterized protein YbjT (DUF2867 family)